ncbi:MAG: hypothetical protein JWO11_4005 [Nocardioides sp.]|nr:hypothetical protein [Nocardioides sp.]
MTQRNDQPSEPAQSTPAGSDTETDTSSVRAPSTAPKDPLRGSRIGGVWAGVLALGVLLVLLVIFIAQNTRRVEVSFLGWEGTAPLAVTLLIATAAGLLLTALAGSLRILQLRRRVKHTRPRDR